MTKSKNTKRTLLASILALILCIAMLIGSTFAWFTDSVTSGKNTIMAGNLDVELEYSTDPSNEDSWVKVDKNTNLFKSTESGEATLWEPGHTEYVYLRVRNAGSLALKYQFSVNVYGDENGGVEKEYTNMDNNKFKLSNYLVFTKTDGTDPVNSREDLWISNADEEKAAMGKLDGLGMTGKLLPNDSKTLTLAVYMPTQVGNVANQLTAMTATEGAPTVFLGLNLVATQDTVEEDSFGNDYDTNAVYPDLPDMVNVCVEEKNFDTSKKTTISSEKIPINGSNKALSIEIPGDSVDTNINNTDILSFSVVLTDSTVDSATYEIKLTDADQNPVELKEGKEATVTVYIPQYLKNVKVVHGDESMESSKITYTSSSGRLKIKTPTWGEFKITYEMDPPYTLNGEMYSSFGNAVAAAESGDTIVCYKNVSSTQTIENKKITIDLNGSTLSPTYFPPGDNVMTVKAGGDVTIKNGTIESDTSGIYTENGAKLTLENVELVTQNKETDCVFAIVANTNNSTVVLKDCTITSEKYGVGVYGNNNNVIIDNCVINAKDAAVYQSGNFSPNSFTIKNSQISGAVGIYISNSIATRDFQSLIVDNCIVTGQTAVEIKHTNATITDCILEATATELTAKPEGSGSCTTGYAIAVTTNPSEANATGTVNVSGTTLSSQVEGGDYFVFQTADNASVTINGNPVIKFNTYTTATTAP